MTSFTIKVTKLYLDTARESPIVGKNSTLRGDLLSIVVLSIW